MTTNHFFQDGDSIGATGEQRLVEDLVLESLKILVTTYIICREL